MWAYFRTRCGCGETRAGSVSVKKTTTHAADLALHAAAQTLMDKHVSANLLVYEEFLMSEFLFWLTTLPDRLKQEFKVDVPSVMWDFGAPGHGKVSDQ